MEIVKLQPAYKDYLWGGNRLVKEYNKNSTLDKTAESWEVSCHPSGESVIASGKDAGKTLTEYLKESKNKYISDSFKEDDSFPILIKFIDSLQSLSIQVHPDDEYALRVEHELGKSEMWYILDANEGAFIYYGVNQEISKEEFKERIENNTILDVLNKVYVKKGDCYFIEAGTIHAIGAGIVICEIQENSNSTYRVYDFNRKDAKGNTRPLHIDKAIDVTNLKPIKTTNDSQKIDDNCVLLASCKYFNTYRYDISREIELEANKDSFNAIIIIEGNGTIENNETKLESNKGDSFFIPASLGQYKIKGNVSFIKVHFKKTESQM